MSFADEIRPLVTKVGGATSAGEICSMSRQIVNAWLRGDVEPSKATQAGAVLLLRRATTKKAAARRTPAVRHGGANDGKL